MRSLPEKSGGLLAFSGTRRTQAGMNNSGTASNYRNRQPKGRRTSGQFANTERPESAIVLDGS